ncbi:MAG: alcohol dehydrogenase catalytic domain-containing protein, partial [Acidobacteriota bacterium]
MKAVRVAKFGGPEVLEYQTVAQPKPGPGQVLIDVKVAGVNFIDTYHREGLYPLELPFTPGIEAAGTVAAVGPGVEEFKPGERVVYTLA